MVLVDVTYHDHEWTQVPGERLYFICGCGRVMVRNGNELTPISYTDYLRLSARIDTRLKAIDRRRASKSGLVIP